MELARFSDLASKEVINYTDGRCLGRFSDCDITINPNNGQILEVILTSRAGLLFSTGPVYAIPWNSIMRIGVDTIIVQLDAEKG